MLKELFSNRLFIGALAFFILCVVGGTLYISHVEKQGAEELATDEDPVKQPTEKQQAKPTETAKTPVGDTSQGGHFHADGTWHGESDQPQGETQGVTFGNLSSNSYQEWLKTYRTEYGEDPPAKGDDWTHTKDPVNGRVSRVYRNTVNITEYDIVTTFAPTPAQLDQYHTLLGQRHKAEESKDTIRYKHIQNELDILKASAQGEVPIIRGSVYIGDKKLTPEEYVKRENEALQRLFKEYGIEHLYGVLY